jgi:CRP-like cAMP-binding protein
MELIGRMMDGSIPSPDRELLPESDEAATRISRDQKIAYLQRIPILEGLTTRQLRAIARITEVMEAPAGQVLTRVGEPGDRFFLLVDGSAHAEVTPDEHPRIGPGEFFGEMSLLDGGPRSATVVTDTPVRLLLIHRRDFSKLLREVPALTQRILVTLCQRLRQAERALNA